MSDSTSLAELRRAFNIALMANYPGTTASKQFLDDCTSLVTGFCREVIGEDEVVDVWPESGDPKKTIANFDRKVRNKQRAEQRARLEASRESQGERE